MMAIEFLQIKINWRVNRKALDEIKMCLCYGLSTLLYIYVFMLSSNYVVCISHIEKVTIVKRHRYTKEGKLYKYSCQRTCKSRPHTRVLY